MYYSVGRGEKNGVASATETRRPNRKVAAFLSELGWGVKTCRPLFLYPQSAFEARHYHDYKQVQSQSGLPVYVVFRGTRYSSAAGWTNLTSCTMTSW